MMSKMNNTINNSSSNSHHSKEVATLITKISTAGSTMNLRAVLRNSMSNSSKGNKMHSRMLRIISINKVDLNSSIKGINMMTFLNQEIGMHSSRKMLISRIKNTKVHSSNGKSNK